MFLFLFLVLFMKNCNLFPLSSISLLALLTCNRIVTRDVPYVIATKTMELTLRPLWSGHNDLNLPSSGGEGTKN